MMGQAKPSAAIVQLGPCRVSMCLSPWGTGAAEVISQTGPQGVYFNDGLMNHEG